MSSPKLLVRGLRLAPLALALALPLAVLAQTPPPSSPPPADAQGQALPDPDKAPSAKNQKIEHLHTQDNNASIDEVRVGGQAQSITVTPNNSKAPPYQVMPNDAQKSQGQGQPDSAPTGGDRVWWNVHKF
jgi:hypothetical protein